ncbi:MAG: histidinol-phosphate transaminase [Planctomycetaceae bacterium]
MPLPFRKNIQQMAGYVSGEQPQTSGWIKLNTNENPYPPSPRVVEAIQQAACGRLNVYPDATARSFREAAAELFGVEPDGILPANGSDENLTIIVRSFCDEDEQIVYPYPSYVLYESLAQIQRCRITRLKLNTSFEWTPADADNVRQSAKLTFVPNPNSPTGNLWSADQLCRILPDRGLLVLDEAYADFAETVPNRRLLFDGRFRQRLVVTRTLSKSYSLAGIRFGFAIADPELIAGMRKVKDSYNCDAVAIAAATAAIKDQDWMLQNRSKILATRRRLAAELPQFGFTVFPSEANFLWTHHESRQHREIYEQLKQHRILVRFMQFPDAGPNQETVDGLRITVGTDDEVDRLLEALRDVTAAVASDGTFAV